MVLHIRQSTQEELALLAMVPSRQVELMRLNRVPTMRLVPAPESESYVNEWSLVEVLRMQASGPDRAA
ncbi:MAG: hypothetical protein HC898_09950 [Phycisphaerales bacterium]|nr:hypothetical protein [Phycisphaerales bacterium]